MRLLPLILIAFASSLASSVLLAQNREVLAEYKIGIVGQDREDALYQAAHLGAKDAAYDLSKRYSIDVELIILTPDKENGGSQTNSLGQLFIEDADGFILSPSTDESLLPALEFAQTQNQQIVLFESDIADFNPLATVLADDFLAGKMAAESLIKEIPSGARVAILSSNERTPVMEARLKGARQALGYRRIETVALSEPNYKAAIETLNKSMDADRNDYISGWLLLGDWPLLGMPALPWRAGELPCVAIQSSPSAFIYIDQGYLDALVVHPYYDWGYSSVSILIDQLFKETGPEITKQVTAPELIDWDNVEAYREKWKLWMR
ncbi:MAG: substrate-binding domain-containing protein [Verrucomicrobiota bacterium]